MESPVGDAAGGIVDGSVLLQICKRARTAVERKVLGCRDKHAPALRHRLDHDPSVTNSRVTNGGIVAFGKHVHQTIIEVERQFDTGIVFEKRVERGPQMKTAKTHRSRNAQRTGEGALPLCYL